ETITAQNADIMAWRRRRNRPSWLRWRERQRAMGPVTVVVIVERHNDPLKGLLVQNQQAVETFAAGRRCQPIRVAGLTMKDRQCARGSNRLAAARNRRSTAVVRGRRVVRRRMASSCRRTMISSSFELIRPRAKRHEFEDPTQQHVPEQRRARSLLHR